MHFIRIDISEFYFLSSSELSANQQKVLNTESVRHLPDQKKVS